MIVTHFGINNHSPMEERVETSGTGGYGAGKNQDYFFTMHGMNTP
jgi:hypothetical protein